MPKPRENSDERAIEKLAGYKNGRAAWDQIELFGLQKIYGGEGAPAHEVYLFQLLDPRWSQFVAKVKKEKIRCERCGAGYRLEVHHPHYVNGRTIWDYEVNEVMLLCRACHAEQHRQQLHQWKMAQGRKRKALKIGQADGGGQVDGFSP
jgi:hypothetical protein